MCYLCRKWFWKVLIHEAKKIASKNWTIKLFWKSAKLDSEASNRQEKMLEHLKIVGYEKMV